MKAQIDDLYFSVVWYEPHKEPKEKLFDSAVAATKFFFKKDPNFETECWLIYGNLAGKKAEEEKILIWG